MSGALYARAKRPYAESVRRAPAAKVMTAPAPSPSRTARASTAGIRARSSEFSRAQALVCGVTSDMVDRRVASGLWQRVYPGVYRLAGVPTTWQQALFAACLAWGDGAVISHRAAGALWGFPGFGPSIELSVPR